MTSIILTLLYLLAYYEIGAQEVTTPEPGIRGDVTVDCGEDAILLSFYTAIPFEGQIYIYGAREQSPHCIATHVWVNQVDVLIPHNECGVVKSRTTSPDPALLEYSVRVVLAFHPRGIITELDQLISIRCLYRMPLSDSNLDMNSLPEAWVGLSTNVTPMRSVLEDDVTTSTAMPPTTTTHRPIVITEAVTKPSTQPTILTTKRVTQPSSSVWTHQVQSSPITRPLIVPAPSLPNQIVETDLDLSQPSGLPIETRDEQFACTYQILSETGGRLALAPIGARIQHKWACSAVAPDAKDLERGAALAQSVRDAGLSCTMEGTLHEKTVRHALVDKYGCSADDLLLPSTNLLHYNDFTMIAHWNSTLMAFDDNSDVQYSCDVTVLRRNGAVCSNVRHRDCENKQSVIEHDQSALKHDVVHVTSQTIRVLPLTVNQKHQAMAIKRLKSSPIAEKPQICLETLTFYIMIGVLTFASLVLPTVGVISCWFMQKRRRSKHENNASTLTATNSSVPTPIPPHHNNSLDRNGPLVHVKRPPNGFRQRATKAMQHSFRISQLFLQPSSWLDNNIPSRSYGKRSQQMPSRHLL